MGKRALRFVAKPFFVCVAAVRSDTRFEKSSALFGRKTGWPRLRVCVVDRSRSVGICVHWPYASNRRSDGSTRHETQVPAGKPAPVRKNGFSRYAAGQNKGGLIFQSSFICPDVGDGVSGSGSGSPTRRATLFACGGMKTVRPSYFFSLSRSRISVSSSMSGAGAAGAAGASSFLRSNLLNSLMNRKMENAMMRKSNVVCRKAP